MQNIPGHRMISFTIGLFVVLFCLWFIFGGFFKVKSTVGDAVNAGGDAFTMAGIQQKLAGLADDAHYKMSATTKEAQNKVAKRASEFAKVSDNLNNETGLLHPINSVKKWWAEHKQSQFASASSKYESAKATDSIFQKDKMENPYTYVKYGVAAILILIIVFFLWKLISMPKTPYVPVAAPMQVAQSTAPVSTPVQSAGPSMFTNVSSGQLNTLCNTLGLDAGAMVNLYGSPEAALATLQRYQRKYSGDVGTIQQKIAEDM